MNNDIKFNLQKIQDRIALACKKSGRSSDTVQLLLATKTVSADRIQAALQSGHQIIAENKVQELKEKYDALKHIPHSNHFIGHLQSNKVKELIKYGVSCVHSIDRFEVAEKLDQRLALAGKDIDVLVQVNTSDEESKFGIAPEEAEQLIRQISKLEHLHIKGLMTIGLFSSSEEKVRACFKRLRKVQTEIKDLKIANVEMTELSMGMSGDLEIAIEEGATIIRVGTAVFGQRATPDSDYWNEHKKQF